MLFSTNIKDNYIAANGLVKEILFTTQHASQECGNHLFA